VLLLAYGFLVGLTAWTFGRRGGTWILRLSEPGQERVRLAAGMLATAVGALGMAVLGLQLGGDDYAHASGWTVGAAVSLGGFVYAAGLPGMARRPGAWPAHPRLGPAGDGLGDPKHAHPWASLGGAAGPGARPHPGAGRAGRIDKLTLARACVVRRSTGRTPPRGALTIEQSGALRNPAAR